jgi:tRNA(adenine34) deaminase
MQTGVNAGETARRYMGQVLTLAGEALDLGEFPIAAILVLDGKVIGRATASERREKRFLGHAELVALEEADRLSLTLEERRRATLYTNLEPCLMCIGGAMSFFLGGICYGLESPGDGAVSVVKGWVRREEDIPGYEVPQISGGVLREESVKLFQRYVLLQPPGPMRDWARTLAGLGEDSSASL